MKNREYISPIVDGQLTTNVRQAIKRLLQGYEGKIIRLSICEHKARRSSSQLGYYWGVIIPYWKAIFEEHGNIVTDADVHAYLVSDVGKLFKPVLNPEGDEVIRNDDGMPVYELRSTSDLNTKEFAQFCDACRSEAATEWGHDIPPPDKFYKEGKDHE